MKDKLYEFSLVILSTIDWIFWTLTSKGLKFYLFLFLLISFSEYINLIDVVTTMRVLLADFFSLN